MKRIRTLDSAIFCSLNCEISHGIGGPNEMGWDGFWGSVPSLVPPQWNMSWGMGRGLPVLLRALAWNCMRMWCIWHLSPMREPHFVGDIAA